MRTDPNALGVLYVKDKSTQYDKEKYNFNPNNIEEWEYRNGLMRSFHDPGNRIYQQELLRNLRSK